jgi:hypothetical protein
LFTVIACRSQILSNMVRGAVAIRFFSLPGQVLRLAAS